MSTERRSVHVRPGRGAAVIQLVMGLLFLMFGLVLTTVGKEDASEPSLWWALTAFQVVWVAGCGALIVYSIAVLRGWRGTSAVVLDIEGGGGDFDERLRKLDGLRRDGLISEEEFRRKRDEIMKEPWS